MSTVEASTQCTSSRKTTSGRRRQTSRRKAANSRFKRSWDAAGTSALDCRIERGAQGAALLLVPDRVSSPGGDCLLAQVFDRHALGGGGLESEAPDQLAHTGFGSRAELLANESLVGAAVL